MKSIVVSLDDETYEALAECAGRELRTVSTQILAMVRQAMGLPFPYEQSPLHESPHLIQRQAFGGRKRKNQHVINTELRSDDMMTHTNGDVVIRDDGPEPVQKQNRRRKHPTPEQETATEGATRE